MNEDFEFENRIDGIFLSASKVCLNCTIFIQYFPQLYSSLQEKLFPNGVNVYVRKKH